MKKEEKKDMSITGKKIPKGIGSLTREASADDPIYTRGYAIGGMRSTNSSKSTQGTNSKQPSKPPEQEEPLTPSEAYEGAILKLSRDMEARGKAATKKRACEKRSGRQGAVVAGQKAKRIEDEPAFQRLCALIDEMTPEQRQRTEEYLKQKMA
jgi:hypothetical protein